MKKRLDILVAEKLNISRAKAQAMIMAGEVLISDNAAIKSGQEYSDDVEITIKEQFPYVSRGALKIEKAAKEFDINFSGKVICDIGASTGGFTDYALQNGAKKVYAIDAGYGQLDQKLRNDSRVINMERTNIKEVENLPDHIDFFVIDVSFISLKKVLPQCKKINPKTPIIALIKPQFEVGKEIADKTRGVIKDDKIRTEVIDNIKQFAENIGYSIEGVTESPIRGAKGNEEFLMYLS